MCVPMTCKVRLQPKAHNPHAVFLVTESEAITYHYELDLTQDEVTHVPTLLITNAKSFLP